MTGPRRGRRARVVEGLVFAVSVVIILLLARDYARWLWALVLRLCSG
ncbi:hypothetical protein [Parasphingorhabdus marina]|nr:hypothetical protein [Parasphingorhabdus marina]